MVNPYSGLIACLALLTLCACTPAQTTPDNQWQHSSDGAYAADISSSGQWIISSGVNSDISVWQLGADAPDFNWQHQGDGNNLVVSVHISHDEKFVVTSDREAFALWSLENGEPVGFWRIDESSVRDIAVANNAAGILVGRGNGKVMYFEPNTQRRLEFFGHTEKINSVDISPNGRYALTGGNDYLALLWDTQSAQVIHRFEHDSRVTRVAIDDQGRYIFTADSKRDSRIWDTQTGDLVSTLNYTARQMIFTDAVFSSDGKYLLTGSPSRRMHLWDIATGNQLAEWKVAPRESTKPPTSVVYAVGFDNEGSILSSSSAGYTAKWTVPTP